MTDSLTSPPVLNVFNTLTPVTTQPFESYLPTAFDSEMTMVQKVNKVINALTTLNTNYNSFVDQWNTVVSWVEGTGLTDAVDTQLTTWLNDGTLDNLITNDVLTDIGNLDKHSFNGALVYALANYPRLTGETDDTQRMIRALNDCVKGSVLFLGDVGQLQISSTISLTKGVKIIGNNTELLTITQGMDNTFYASGVDGLSFVGLKFNQNMMGRTSISLDGCTNALIYGCYFTGYSATYQYYKTDGGTRFTNCSNVKVIGNTWENHGYQYDSSTATLNRCCQFQGTTTDNAIVYGNIFNQVNQAIIVGAGNVVIGGNTFKNIRDNALYMVTGVQSVVFSGNFVDHRYDEAIAIENGTLVMTGNQIKNASNKAIAIAGGDNSTNLVNIVCTGNSFDLPDVSTGQFIVWRDMSYVVQHLHVADNRFNCPSNSTTYDYFGIGNVNRIDFENNHVKVSASPFQRIIYLEGTTASGVIRNNRFSATGDGSCKTIEVAASVVSPDVVYETNSHSNCRGVFGGLVVIGHNVQFSAGPYILDRIKQMRIANTSIPTSGSFTAGDYCENTTPTINGTTGSLYIIKGWKRITTGSNHVLNTDWVQDRSLTGY